MKDVFSPLMLNVLDDDGTYLCPCCGLGALHASAPYNEHGGIIGSDICGACLWEPGFDDDPLASAVAEPTILGSLLSYRVEWIAAGRLWWGSTKFGQPQVWNAEAALKKLRLRAHHLFGPET